MIHTCHQPLKKLCVECINKKGAEAFRSDAFWICLGGHLALALLTSIAATLTFLGCLFLCGLRDGQANTARPPRQAFATALRDDHVLNQGAAGLLKEGQLSFALIQTDLN